MSSASGNAFSGIEMAQAWQDLALWESFLNAYRCRSIVELGTYHGGFPLFLAIQSRIRGAAFLTIDHRDSCDSAEAVERLGAKREHFDLLSEHPSDLLAALGDPLPRPPLLYCDDGNKPQEVRRFAPLPRIGDCLAIHDWNHEIGSGDILVNLVPVHEKDCQSIDSLTRLFKVQESIGRTD